MKKTDHALEEAHNSALRLDWRSTVNSLVAAEESLNRASMLSIPYPIPPDLVNKLAFLELEKVKLDRALSLAAGVRFTAEADRGDVVEADEFRVTVGSYCRPDIKCEFGAPEFVGSRLTVQNKKDNETAVEGSWKISLTPSTNTWPAEPDGSRRKLHSYPPAEPELSPDPTPVLVAFQKIKIGSFELTTSIPVTHTTATSTSVSRVPIRIVPAYTLFVDPSQSVEILSQPRKSFDILLRVHSYTAQPAKVFSGLYVPDGLTSGAPVELSFDGIGDQYAKLPVTPSAKLVAGNYTITAYAKRGDEKFSTMLEPLPTMPTILWSNPAQTVVHAFDINVPPDLLVGYVSAEGEMIPDALKRLGIKVEMLDSNALTFGDLSKYSAIVVGVRAYELRPELASANKRLLEYVSNGGTLIVQYNRDYIWNKFLPAPYHATIGNPTPRITDENADVKFLKPDDRLLNWPNKITQDDFKNWVQERGLYYWSDFDARYTPLLSMHDPGERDLTGGLVYTALGKGTYIYTGLAFFRELPEGIPGAYRLFVNLLSASQPVR